MFKSKCIVITVILVVMSLFAVYAEDEIDDTILTESVQKTFIKLDNVSLAYGVFVCDGKTYRPKVTVTVNGTVCREGRDYTVSYNAGVNPGNNSVTVKGQGSYAGTVLKTYWGDVQPPQNLKLKQTKKDSGVRLNASWGKAYCNGYMVELYCNGSMMSQTYTENTSFEKLLTKSGKYSVRVYSNLKNTRDNKVYKSEPVQSSTDVTVPEKMTITKMAIKCAWPVDTKSSKNSYKKGSATKEYKTALDKAYPSRVKWRECSKKGASCDVFVGTVIRNTGYDNISSSLSSQYSHLQKSSKWQKIKWKGKQSELKSGDILYAKHKKKKKISCGHIYIYVVKDGKPYIAEASAGNYYPILHSYYSRYKWKKEKYVNVYRAMDASVR